VVNQSGRDFFQKVLGTKIQDKIILNCETNFYFKEGRTNYHSKVILKTSNFKITSSYIKRADSINFEGRDGILIENPSPNMRMWDLLIIGEN